jgi:uncharacterized protein YndB with AHSA1/START domain
MSENEPLRRLELQIDVDAPLAEAWKAITTGPGLASWFAPIAEVSGQGAGATVTNGWSPEMMMSHTVGAWEPMKHVSWIDKSGWPGPGTSLVCDYTLSTEKGKTRIRLVQSAFGPSDAWDDLFDGMEVGWRYFLYNLRIYLEKHPGRARHLISERLPVAVPRRKFWEHLLSGAAGLVRGGTGAVQAGETLQLELSDADPVRGVVEVLVQGRGLGLRLPELSDALLFIELEGKSDEFHVGYWLSVYDPAQAKRIESLARAAFKRIHETLP